jgi:acyl-coenzyme A synthetase/AMP-(fatty) acid ligase/acyl carrier protein
VDEETRNDPVRLIAFLAEHRITQAFLPTPLAQVVLDGPEAAAPGLAVRFLLTGGDRLHRVPNRGLTFDLINHYGPTEGTVVATAGKVAPDDPRLPGIGTVISTARIYVLDAFGEPAPIGAPGELFIGGAGVSPGYWGQPRLTAERFVPDQFGDASGGRLFRTGDAARYRADGSLEFLGRLDRQIKRRGYRIEPGEIERTLARLPQVRRSAVELIAADGTPERLVAVVESDQDDGEGGALWREHLARFLPTYMVPDAFVAVAHLPLLASGKLDRQAVAALARQAQPPAADVHVAPRRPLERQLAAIWAELLGVDRVGLQDNFFALGGHSMLVIQLLARIRAELGIELNIRDVFENASLGQLHDHLAQLQCSSDVGDQTSNDDADRERGML